MVGADNRVVTWLVQIGERVGTMWVISKASTLANVFVAEGHRTRRPGVQVQPRPFQAS